MLVAQTGRNGEWNARRSCKACTGTTCLGPAIAYHLSN
ncbi:MAG: hypothetical protein OJF48_002246 [Afipia sp.]|nr:MAG: hypothetical protein OJF48_002246 [Afipia sp.]